MEIKTAFGINDLVQFKYQRKPSSQKGITIPAYEVIEIQTVTCSAGTQNFYRCRPISVHYETVWGEPTGEEGKLPPRTKILKDVGFARIGDHDYVKFREDEIKPCPKEVADQIKEIQESESGQ
jgi:hypothetical protein